jgi:hypothetical protein
MRAGRLLLQRNRQTDLWEICVTEGSGTLNDSGAALRGKSYDNRSFDSGRNLAYAAWRRADAKASALWTQAEKREIPADFRLDRETLSERGNAE